jgi:heme/copper-type cytochrome/quinol oxidase subunit 2
MKKIVTIIASMVAMLGIALTPLVPTPAYATRDCDDLDGSEQAGCAACIVENTTNDWDSGECDRGDESDLTEIIRTVINVMLFIVGILSVVMIVFGGIRYASSAGNKNAVDSAKNTIIYSVVGLVVAIVAFALVQWIFDALT